MDTNERQHEKNLELFSSELAKEQAMLSKVFGAYIVGNYSDGPDFAKDLIEAINYALGLKDVFKRNLSVILETKGKKGTFSYFPTYFNMVWEEKADAIANEVGKLMESNRNTDLAILAKEVADKYLPGLIRAAIIKMFSAKPEIKNDKHKRLEVFCIQPSYQRTVYTEHITIG